MKKVIKLLDSGSKEDEEIALIIYKRLKIKYVWMLGEIIMSIIFSILFIPLLLTIVFFIIGFKEFKDHNHIQIISFRDFYYFHQRNTSIIDDNAFPILSPFTITVAITKAAIKALKGEINDKRKRRTNRKVSKK